jgi:hypothetical protein
MWRPGKDPTCHWKGASTTRKNDFHIPHALIHKNGRGKLTFCVSGTTLRQVLGAGVSVFETLAIALD